MLAREIDHDIILLTVEKEELLDAIHSQKNVLLKQLTRAVQRFEEKEKP